MKRVVCLSGGIGGAKLALGLSKCLAADELTIISNTGDDIQLLGLRICPDIDTLLYTLSGKANPRTGWGIDGDSFRCLEQLGCLGWDAWFQLGDLDLATHLWRAELLRNGLTLTQATARIADRLGIDVRILPVTDNFAPTMILTDDRRTLHLQEYLICERCEPRVKDIIYQGAAESRPGECVLDAIREADLVVLAPSNPFISVGPMLAIPGFREALRQAKAHRIAVSPIIQGRALKGPAAKMFADMGSAPSAHAVAELYADFLDVMVVDTADASCTEEIEQLGVRAVALPAVMQRLEDKVRLAEQVLGCARIRMEKP